MSEKAKVGTTVLKNRNIQRLWFILVVVIPAAIIGVYLGAAQAKNPETSVLNKIEEAPVTLIVLVAVFLMTLLVYNWIRFDEFERPRYDSSSSFALFASLLLVPWYVAGVQGLVPPLHPLTSVVVFFGLKWLFHFSLKIPFLKLT